jgi:osmotically-inducible protein OsmY
MIKRVLACFVISFFLTLSAPAQKAVSDDYITDMVRQKLAADQVVKGGAIEVTVKGGVVTLAGKVQEPKQKSRAEKLAHGIKGVKSVVNEVKIEHP